MSRVCRGRRMLPSVCSNGSGCPRASWQWRSARGLCAFTAPSAGGGLGKPSSRAPVVARAGPGTSCKRPCSSFRRGPPPNSECRWNAWTRSFSDERTMSHWRTRIWRGGIAGADHGRAHWPSGHAWTVPRPRPHRATPVRGRPLGCADLSFVSWGLTSCAPSDPSADPAPGSSADPDAPRGSSRWVSSGAGALRLCGRGQP